jgi:Lrp/AsnC family leucine-responsive transcriptional regulator
MTGWMNLIGSRLMQSSATTVSLRSNSPKKSALSAWAVQRRLKRLHERKVIEAEVAIVSPEALGRNVTAIVEVTLNTDRPKVVEEFQRAIQAAPEVLQAY